MEPQMEDKQKPRMALAMDETVRALYPTFRAMVFKELGERFEELAEGRETIPVAEVRKFLMLDEEMRKLLMLDEAEP
jgi:hypothetical protein